MAGGSSSQLLNCNGPPNPFADRLTVDQLTGRRWISGLSYSQPPMWPVSDTFLEPSLQSRGQGNEKKCSAGGKIGLWYALSSLFVTLKNRHQKNARFPSHHSLLFCPLPILDIIEFALVAVHSIILLPHRQALTFVIAVFVTFNNAVISNWCITVTTRATCPPCTSPLKKENPCLVQASKLKVMRHSGHITSSSSEDEDPKGHRSSKPLKRLRTGDVATMPTTPFGMPKDGLRRSTRLQQRVFNQIRAGNIINTPGGSSIQSFHCDDPAAVALSPRRIQTDKLKRRLQFKGGVGCKIVMSEAYKNLKKDEMAKDYHKEKRQLREQVFMKSRGLSLPQASRTTRRMSTAMLGAAQSSITVGEAPGPSSASAPSTLQPPPPPSPSPSPSQQQQQQQQQKPPSKEMTPFFPRHNLRPRPMRADNIDALLRPPNQHVRFAEERRRKMYKGRRKSDVSLDFVPWKDRDENWRRQRVEKYMSSTKLAREASVIKNRKLQICGYGNPKLNLGNYLSICSEYYPELDWDRSQRLPDRRMANLTRWNDKGEVQDTGVIYYPDVVSDPKRPHIRGFCFTVQSELALQFEKAQKVVFDQASQLVNHCFRQYYMDLSLDASLDDGFTVDMFLSSELSGEGVEVNVVHAVTQFIFMRSYIYVDKICVSHHMMRLGIGSFMMERLIDLAEKRGKDILLYALGPVVPVYRRWGFKECKEWPVQEEDLGMIMRKRVATKDVIDDYDCGMDWNGGGFTRRMDAQEGGADGAAQVMTPSSQQSQSQSQPLSQSQTPDSSQSQSPSLNQCQDQDQDQDQAQSQQ